MIERPFVPESLGVGVKGASPCLFAVVDKFGDDTESKSVKPRRSCVVISAYQTDSTRHRR